LRRWHHIWHLMTIHSCNWHPSIADRLRKKHAFRSIYPDVVFPELPAQCVRNCIRSRRQVSRPKGRGLEQREQKANQQGGYTFWFAWKRRLTCRRSPFDLHSIHPIFIHNAGLSDSPCNSVNSQPPCKMVRSSSGTLRVEHDHDPCDKQKLKFLVQIVIMFTNVYNFRSLFHVLLSAIRLQIFIKGE
jgi:hypothetical protein